MTVIFQNRDYPETHLTIDELSKCTEIKSKNRRRALETTLPCQELLKSGLYKKTGDIPEIFSPILNVNPRKEISKQVDEDHFLWWYFRNIFHHRERATDKDEQFVPSFTAINSKLDKGSSTNVSSTSTTHKSFIPILPHPATTMDSIYTSMVNFCDVLRQREEDCGAMKGCIVLHETSSSFVLRNLGIFSWDWVPSIGVE